LKTFRAAFTDKLGSVKKKHRRICDYVLGYGLTVRAKPVEPAKIPKSLERHPRLAGNRIIDWEAIEPIFAKHLGAGEKAVVNWVIVQIELGIFAQCYDWPEIARIEFEFPVPRGRVDIVLFHIDGSITAIECKGGSTWADVAPAIGQVMAYGVMLGYSRTASKIRLAVASHASSETLKPYRSVFRKAGIEPVFVADHSVIAREFIRLAEAV